MSGQISAPSRRRMDALETFVHLTAPYVTVENYSTKLPELAIDITGLPESQEMADTLLEAIRDAVAALPGLYTVRERKSA